MRVRTHKRTRERPIILALTPSFLPPSAIAHRGVIKWQTGSIPYKHVDYYVYAVYAYSHVVQEECSLLSLPLSQNES